MVKSILFPLPYDGSNFKNPYLTNDGNTLFFSSDMNGYGGYDIWMIKKKSNGFWSMPINLGININTIKDELYPYICDNTFYFSSNGQLGFGGFDIFVATIDRYYNVSDVSTWVIQSIQQMMITDTGFLEIELLCHQIEMVVWD